MRTRLVAGFACMFAVSAITLTRAAEEVTAKDPFGVDVESDQGVGQQRVGDQEGQRFQGGSQDDPFGNFSGRTAERRRGITGATMGRGMGERNALARAAAMDRADAAFLGRSAAGAFKIVGEGDQALLLDSRSGDTWRLDASRSKWHAIQRDGFLPLGDGPRTEATTESSGTGNQPGELVPSDPRVIERHRKTALRLSVSLMAIEELEKVNRQLEDSVGSHQQKIDELLNENNQLRKELELARKGETPQKIHSDKPSESSTTNSEPFEGF